MGEGNIHLAHPHLIGIDSHIYFSSSLSNTKKITMVIKNRAMMIVIVVIVAIMSILIMMVIIMMMIIVQSGVPCLFIFEGVSERVSFNIILPL